MADCVFQAAAAVMIWFQTAKRLVISIRHSGADQMTAGTKVLSDVAEGKQDPLGLPRPGEAFHHPFPGTLVD